MHAVGPSTDSCRAADAAEDAGAAEEGLAGATSSRSASLYSAHRRVMGVQGERATSGLSMEGSGVSEPFTGLDTCMPRGERSQLSHAFSKPSAHLRSQHQEFCGMHEQASRWVIASGLHSVFVISNTPRATSLTGSCWTRQRHRCKQFILCTEASPPHPAPP